MFEISYILTSQHLANSRGGQSKKHPVSYVKDSRNEHKTVQYIMVVSVAKEVIDRTGKTEIIDRIYRKD